MDALYYIRDNNRQPEDLSKCIDAVSLLIENVESIRLMMIHPVGFLSLNDSIEEVKEYEIRNEMNEGEKATLRLYLDLYPHLFTREEIEKKIDEMREFYDLK